MNAETEIQNGGEATPSQKVDGPTGVGAKPSPNGLNPKYWPAFLTAKYQPSEKPDSKPELPADAVRLDYELVLHGGAEQVVRVKSQLVLPLALADENLPLTDVGFPALLDQVIVRPLITKFRGFLQKRFDAASRAGVERPAIAKASSPAAVEFGLKFPRSTNGTGPTGSKARDESAMFRMPGMVASQQ
jgi:hypothetical protein